jgi:hypothetical protein
MRANSITSAAGLISVESLISHARKSRIRPRVFSSMARRNAALVASSGTSAAPAGVNVQPAEGITIGFPVDPKPGNSYRLYDPTTQLTGELVYQGTASRGGRSVYTYSTTITGAVKDKTLAATLPSALPTSVLTSLTPALPADAKAQLTPVAPHLPAIVPLGYESTTTATADVNQSTGILVDQAITEPVTPTLSVDGTNARASFRSWRPP